MDKEHRGTVRDTMIQTQRILVIILSYKLARLDRSDQSALNQCQFEMLEGGSFLRRSLSNPRVRQAGGSLPQIDQSNHCE